MKNLTVRYSVTQFFFWAAHTGISSFAAAYLLDRGLPSGAVGILLAAAGALSCLTQPLLAGMADRAKGFILRKMLICMSVLCAVCTAVQLLPGISVWVAGSCYMAAIWSGDAMVPLTNALCVSYGQSGYPIDYGSARGIGSAASAVSALVLGHVLARYGAGWMLLTLVLCRGITILSLLAYPKIEKPAAALAGPDKSCSIPAFFLHYPRYCFSLLGVLFLGMFLAMSENYLIAIMERLGGNSGHVGTALFIASMVGAPVIFCFSHVRKFLRDAWLLKIAALSLLLKAILYYAAADITTIYLLQLLHATSYAFLAPTQVFYANASVRECDMVKGQAFSTAAYALGCSAGNFAGGQLLPFGVDAILMAGIAMALAGTVIIFLTVNGKTEAQFPSA